MSSKYFTVNDKPELSIEVSCNVAILEGDRGVVSVEVEGDEDDTVSVSQKGQTIEVKQRSFGSGNVVIGGSSGGVTISGSGVSVVTSGGVTYINSGSGNVVVNGVNVSTGKPVKPIVIKVHIPAGYDLEAVLEGEAQLAASVQADQGRIESRGCAKAVLTCSSVEVDSSGSSEIKAHLQGGDVELSCSGSSSVEIRGSYSKVSASTSGAAGVRTHGRCTGDYKASASGASSIAHFGSVGGRVRERCSGCARISV